MQELRCVFKKFLCVFLVFLTTLLSSVCYVRADGSYSLSDLKNCTALYSYSGKNNAYFYGNSNYTLYSARALPSRTTRYVKVSGYISAVCHDENCAYALYKAGNDSYGVVRMNMNNGSCDHCTISGTSLAQKYSFAVSGNEIFIIHTSNTFPYVKSYDFDGKYLRSYTFPKGAECLFSNGGSAYVKAYSGEVFRLSGANKSKCAEIDTYTAFADAGVGYILQDNNRLVLLNGGKVQHLQSDFAVITSQNKFHISGTTLRFNGGEAEVSSPRLMCAAGTTAAVLDNDFNCQITDAKAAVAESQSPKNSKLSFSGKMITGIEENTTVAKIKEKYPEIKKIFDHDGKEITSGKLKTGYSALIQNGEYKIAIRGDVNSSGTLNTADTDELMKALAGSITLSDCCQKAADYNFDGSADTKDLVLIGKKIR